MNLCFDMNRLLVVKPEDQKRILPTLQELNEQELMAVTGGWASDDGGGDDHHHRHRRHRRHHHEHHNRHNRHDH